MKLKLQTRRLCLALAAAAVLAGCFNGKEKPLTLADDPARVSYLQELGWQVESTPVETLDLQLPQELAETWGEYAAMQTAQVCPSRTTPGSRCAGIPTG